MDTKWKDRTSQEIVDDMHDTMHELSRLEEEEREESDAGEPDWYGLDVELEDLVYERLQYKGRPPMAYVVYIANWCSL